MENKVVLRKKLRGILKTFLWGAGITELMIITFLIGRHFGGGGGGDEFWPSFYFGTSVLAGALAYHLNEAIGLEVNPFVLFPVIVGIICGILAAIWQFLLKVDDEI